MNISIVNYGAVFLFPLATEKVKERERELVRLFAFPVRNCWKCQLVDKNG